MSRCALVGAVDFNHDHFRQQSFDCIIAVDRGYEHLVDCGIEPDIVMGDFDSLGYIPEHLGVEVFPRKKDASDVELALEKAFDRGFEELFVYGCLSHRLDHTYGVLQLLHRFSRKGAWVFGIGDTFACVALAGGEHDSLRFEQGAQGTISVFAMSDSAQGVTEKGLIYPLENAGPHKRSTSRAFQ